jgi:hypothetical protein
MKNDKSPDEYSSLESHRCSCAEKLLSRDRVPYIYHVDMLKAATTNEVEWIVGNSTDLKTAFSGSYGKVDIVSASTDDKSAASGDVQKVKIWGIDRYYNYRIEEIQLSGTTAVSSTNSYRAINTVWASSWGTGGNDAKGTITVGPTGKVTQVVATISAAKNSMQTARIWIPKNWRARMIHFAGSLADNTSPNIAGGITFQPQYTDDYANADPDFYTKIGVLTYTPQHVDDLMTEEVGSDNTISKLTVVGEAINNSNLETFYLGIEYLLWGNSNVGDDKGTSQDKYIQGDV